MRFDDTNPAKENRHFEKVLYFVIKYERVFHKIILDHS